MDSRSRRTHFPDLRSADRRRLFNSLFEDDQTFSDPEMFYETTPRPGWHQRAFFNDNDDWPTNRFPSRQSSFATNHNPSKTAGFRSGFDDFGVPVRVMHETSPDKSWQKQKERHNSTGSSAATSSSTGSNDSTGNSTHKPRVFHIPIQVEPREHENVAKTSRKSPPRKISPERQHNEQVENEKAPNPLARSVSYASEPAKDSSRFTVPQGPRAHSVPTETPTRRISPERKRLSPDRARGINRTQSMNYRPTEQHRVYHHPIKVENISMSPRRSNPETVQEEVTYNIPRGIRVTPDMENFCTLPRIPLRREVEKSQPSHDRKPPQFTSSSQVNMKGSNTPSNDSTHHVTRIPVNIHNTNNESHPMKISADSIKQAMNDAAEKRKQMDQSNESAEGDVEMQPAKESSPSSSIRETAIPAGWEKKEEEPKQQSSDKSSSDVNDGSVKRQAPLPPKLKMALDKIANIQGDVKLLKEDINNFNGTIYDKDYLQLDEKLTQNMLKLDVIETEGQDEVRKARKSTVQEIQACLSLLETRVNKNIPLTNGKSDEQPEQEEGYCSMETEQITTPESTPMECEEKPAEETVKSKPDEVTVITVSEQTKL